MKLAVNIVGAVVLCAITASVLVAYQDLSVDIAQSWLCK